MPGTECLALLCKYIPDRYEHVIIPRLGREYYSF